MVNATDAYSTGKIITISDDGIHASAVYTSGDWREPLKTNSTDTSGKKKFERLIKKASQSVPKEQDSLSKPNGD